MCEPILIILTNKLKCKIYRPREIKCTNILLDYKFYQISKNYYISYNFNKYQLESLILKLFLSDYLSVHVDEDKFNNKSTIIKIFKIENLVFIPKKNKSDYYYIYFYLHNDFDNSM